MFEFEIGRFRLPVATVRRAIVAAGLTAAVVGVVTLLTPQRYSAGFTMVPQVSDAGNSGLSSIASQLGVNIGSIDLTQSPLFYSELLGSRAFMLGLSGGSYLVEGAAGPRDSLLYEWMKAPGATPEQRHERAAILLRGKTAISSSARSGIVRFVVTLKDSALVRQVAMRALAQIDSFNLRTKQTQARAERAFLELRADSLEWHLRNAEDALVRFDDRNRAATLAPALRTERDRLSREKQVVENVAGIVRQQLERARMEEVRNTPVITIVEAVRSPTWPERRYLLFKTVAVAVAMTVLWLGAFLLLVDGALDGLLPPAWLSRLRRGLGGDGASTARV